MISSLLNPANATILADFMSGLRQGLSVKEAEIEQATTGRRYQTYNSRLSMVSNTVRRQGRQYIYACRINSCQLAGASELGASMIAPMAAAAATKPLSASSSASSICDT